MLTIWANYRWGAVFVHFGVNPAYADRLEPGGLRVVGSDAEGVVRAANILKRALPLCPRHRSVNQVCWVRSLRLRSWSPKFEWKEKARTLAQDSLNYVGAAINRGTLGIAYCPKTPTITATCRSSLPQWRQYDATTGQFRDITRSPIANSGSRSFTTLGANGQGDFDWVLVLEIGRWMITLAQMTPMKKENSQWGRI
jgi:hypothetical protein